MSLLTVPGEYIQSYSECCQIADCAVILSVCPQRLIRLVAIFKGGGGGGKVLQDSMN